MSEFTCTQGHLVRPSVGYCEECGGRIVRMDGKSNAQLKAEEEEWDREVEERGEVELEREMEGGGID